MSLTEQIKFKDKIFMNQKNFKIPHIYLEIKNNPVNFMKLFSNLRDFF